MRYFRYAKKRPAYLGHFSLITLSLICGLALVLGRFLLGCERAGHWDQYSHYLSRSRETAGWLYLSVWAIVLRCLPQWRVALKKTAGLSFDCLIERKSCLDYIIFISRLIAHKKEDRMWLAVSNNHLGPYQIYDAGVSELRDNIRWRTLRRCSAQ